MDETVGMLGKTAKRGRESGKVNKQHKHTKHFAVGDVNATQRASLFAEGRCAQAVLGYILLVRYLTSDAALQLCSSA